MDKTIVIDLFSATVESEINNYLSEITPNNYLSFMDFLKDSEIVAPEDFVDEIEYSSTEY